MKRFYKLPENQMNLEGDPGIEPGTFGSGDQRSIH